MDFKDTKYDEGGVVEEHILSNGQSEVVFKDSPPLDMLSAPQQQSGDKKAAVLSRSKYEMNLAEFPLALLSKRKLKEVRIITYKDTITGNNGEVIEREWTVSPSARYGFGSTTITSSLFELFQIWKEQGFESPHIRFGSVYNLIQRMGLRSTDDSAYERIRNDLTALVEISIEAKNAFWDNEKKAYVTKIFHLFDSATLLHRNPKAPQQGILPMSYITASETLMQSVAANAVITLRGVDRELFHSFTPTQQRLALYLSKMLHHSTEHRRDVEKLAQQLPITAKSYKDTKTLLSRACDGLIEKGFPYLAKSYFEKSRRSQKDNIVFVRNGTLPTKANPESGDRRAKNDLLVEDIIGVTGAADRRGFYGRAVRVLPPETILTCLSITQAAKQQHEIKKTPDRFFTGLLLDYATKHGIRI